ncbi:hypothetical protein [Parachlamydia acanthamoebae]|uniref:Uncharacterized protein n=1 Tax=Parachlamydia acanthamoebae TaxID=83552 RepID=A0A0C1C145_9BACT|nr:hypothetical protein [Parachlamydia acanthamoebae]KIA77411.1 hypothetical protein DB43_GI00110 [Parachlamydia acanthamoebae]
MTSPIYGYGRPAPVQGHPALPGSRSARPQPLPSPVAQQKALREREVVLSGRVVPGSGQGRNVPRPVALPQARGVVSIQASCGGAPVRAPVGERH